MMQPMGNIRPGSERVNLVLNWNGIESFENFLPSNPMVKTREDGMNDLKHQQERFQCHVLSRKVKVFLL